MEEDEKDRTYIFFTLIKFFEAGFGVYASYCIVSRMEYKEPLFMIYITWPTYVMLALVIGIERIIFYKKMPVVSIFEIAVSLSGFVFNMSCSIVVMYYLPRVDYIEQDEVGKTTWLELGRFDRSISAAVSSVITASIYLIDGFLSTDILLRRDGYTLWKEPQFPNPQVDLPENLRLRMLFPWENRLKEESIFKKIYDLKKTKAELSKVNE